MLWLFFSLRFGFWLRLILPQQRKMIKWQWQTRTMSKIAVTIKINEKGIEWQVFGRHRFATSFEGLLDVCYVLRFQSEAWKFSQTLKKIFWFPPHKTFPSLHNAAFFLFIKFSIIISNYQKNDNVLLFLVIKYFKNKVKTRINKVKIKD